MSYLNLTDVFLTMHKIGGRPKRPHAYKCEKEFGSGR
jgi:hypothetical protein